MSDGAAKPSARLTWSTEDVAAADRFSYWRDSICAAFDPMSPELQRDARAQFDGRITAWQLGDSALMEIRAAHHDTGRSRGDIAQGSHDYVYLYRQRAEAWFDFDYQPGLVSRAGTLTLGDADRAFRTGPTGARPFHHHVLKIPRALLRPALANADDVATTVVSAPFGIGALLLNAFDALVREVEHLAPDEAAAALQSLASLAAAALGRTAADHDPREAVQAAQLSEARAFISRHAVNPALGPGLVASALGMSVRQLHRLFEAAGDTVSRHILQCRLEAARDRLRAPAFRQETILDLALACGFTSLPTFYRTFRAVYGVAPAEFRRAG